MHRTSYLYLIQSGQSLSLMPSIVINVYLICGMWDTMKAEGLAYKLIIINHFINIQLSKSHLSFDLSLLWIDKLV